MIGNNKYKHTDFGRIGGKDWDKYIECEGCGQRPTQCTCKKDDIKNMIIVGIVFLCVCLVSFLLVKITL